MKHVGSVVFAMLAGDIATMDFSISDERLRRDDVPRYECRTELFIDFSVHLSLTAPAGQHDCVKS